MAVDLKGQRLFVPGEHQRTIEVIDLRAGKVIHTITGFGGDPRKTIYLPEVDQIWVGRRRLHIESLQRQLLRADQNDPADRVRA